MGDVPPLHDREMPKEVRAQTDSHGGSIGSADWEDVRGDTGQETHIEEQRSDLEDGRKIDKSSG